MSGMSCDAVSICKRSANTNALGLSVCCAAHPGRLAALGRCGAVLIKHAIGKDLPTLCIHSTVVSGSFSLMKLALVAVAHAGE